MSEVDEEDRQKWGIVCEQDGEFWYATVALLLKDFAQLILHIFCRVYKNAACSKIVQITNLNHFYVRQLC